MLFKWHNKEYLSFLLSIIYHLLSFSENGTIKNTFLFYFIPFYKLLKNYLTKNKTSFLVFFVVFGFSRRKMYYYNEPVYYKILCFNPIMLLKFDNHYFSSQSIIDLVVYPGLNVSLVISPFIEGFTHIIILDTQGNLYEEYARISSKNTINSEESAFKEELKDNKPKTTYYFISSIEHLYKAIENLKQFKNFVLIFDCITFVWDMNHFCIRSFALKLWSLIYISNATIITVNHYRHNIEDKTQTVIPRLGIRWEECISYRISFYNKGDKIEYNIKKINYF